MFPVGHSGSWRMTLFWIQMQTPAGNVPVLFVCLFSIWLRILCHGRADVTHTTRQTPLGAACPRLAPLSHCPLAPG